MLQPGIGPTVRDYIESYELSANALKYGAWSSERGSVHLEYRIAHGIGMQERAADPK
jgi:hypothetical protein